LILLLSLSAAVAFALGNIFERIGLSGISKKIPLSRPLKFIAAMIRNWRWWLGIGLSSYATIAYYIAVAKWNLSLVQPLLTLNPVLTAVLGRWWLKEHLDKFTLWAIVCNIVGLLLVSTQVGEESGVREPEGLWTFVFGWLAVLTLIGVRQFKQQEFRDGLITGTGFGLATVLWKYVSQKIEWSGLGTGPWTDRLANLAEFLGEAAVLAYVIAYLTGFVFSQIALSRGRALFVIPFSAALGTFIPVIAGWMVFHEPVNALKVTSVLAILTGSVLFIKAGEAETLRRNLASASQDTPENKNTDPGL